MDGSRRSVHCLGDRYDDAIMRTSAPLLVILLAVAAPAAAQREADAAAPERARAVEIVDGDTLMLEDGLQVRLVGIQAPKLPLGRPNFQAWPLAEEAKAALSRLALDRELRLAYGGRRMDRHGRLLAQLYTAGDGGAERWVQGALLEAGMARVYSFADNRALVPEMLALETRARAQRRGIWAHPYYAIRDPEAAGAHIGSFQLVEGRVLEAAVVRGRAYLNFGADWREDFTITLAPEVRRRFEAESIDPRDYQAARVRVRGWLKSFNGPMIEVTHPEQIEVLAP
jgi:endonuclease YncB( thermonuclease family)